MSFQNQDYHSVTRYLPRSNSFLEHFKNELGKVDSDVAFDNEFQQFKLIIKLIGEMSQAIEQEIIKVPKELQPDKKIVDEIDKIWYGQTWYGVARDDSGNSVVFRKLYCNYPPEQVYDANENPLPLEIIELPALKDMIPVNKISDDSWAIQIRTTLPLYIALNGASYESVINEGKFVSPDGQHIRIRPDDMYSSFIRTQFIHRPVYFQLVGDLASHFQKRYNVLNMNWQRIITYVDENDLSWLQESDEQSDMSLVVDEP